MSKRNKRKSQHKLPKWLSPLHRKLYPPMTKKRRMEIREDLEKNRNTITRFWRRIEDFPLDMPPSESFERGLVGGHREEDYENDRRRLRLRLFYWACLFAPLIYLEWIVVSLILGGFTLMVELWQWGCQSVKQRAYPNWEPGPMLGWMILLLIVEAVYVAVAFGIFYYQERGYWAIVTYPFIAIAGWFVMGYAWGLLLQGYKTIKAKLAGRREEAT